MTQRRRKAQLEKRNWLALSLLLTCAVVALVSCGGGGALAPTPTPTPPPPNPVPQITSLSPPGTDATGPDFTLVLYGSGFITASVVRWNGFDRTTTFVASDELRAAILASDIADVGEARVRVFNPPPGGGNSNAVTFMINIPQATLTSLSPSSATACGPGFILTVNGTGFIPTSLVEWGGSRRPTTYVSSTQVTTLIPASYIATGGTVEVTVFNPWPEGGGGILSANGLPFIVDPAPLNIFTTRLPDTTGGKFYDFTLAACGGTPPLRWRLTTDNGLPANLWLEETMGRIAGPVQPVPTDTTANFTVQATDSSSPQQTDTQDLSIVVRAVGLGRNDSCPDGATPISNGNLRAALSPYGDIDVYSFQATAGQLVTIETIARRLVPEAFTDTVVELLDSACTLLIYNDDIDPGIIQDSLILNFSLPSDGTYYIRVRDFRGDGRPDLIYELRLSGAN